MFYNGNIILIPELEPSLYNRTIKWKQTRKVLDARAHRLLPLGHSLIAESAAEITLYVTWNIVNSCIFGSGNICSVYFDYAKYFIQILETETLQSILQFTDYGVSVRPFLHYIPNILANYSSLE